VGPHRPTTRRSLRGCKSTRFAYTMIVPSGLISYFCSPAGMVASVRDVQKTCGASKTVQITPEPARPMSRKTWRSQERNTNIHGADPQEIRGSTQYLGSRYTHACCLVRSQWHRSFRFCFVNTFTLETTRSAGRLRRRHHRSLGRRPECPPGEYQSSAANCREPRLPTRMQPQP
jgi:hypothetical protein